MNKLFAANKIVISGVLFAIAVIFSTTVLLKNEAKMPENQIVSENSKPTTTGSIVLFYGDGCSHCALVEKFVAENGIKSKIQFTEKEVYYNKQNAEELADKARVCGMRTDSISVPFLWDGSNCLVGDQDIIEFLKTKASRQ